MIRLLKFISLLLLLLIHKVFAQNTANDNLAWLQTITSHAIAAPLAGASFHRAPDGFALYFSKRDTANVPYLVYVPRHYDSSQPHSLIIYLHGGVVSIDSFQYNNAAFAANEPVFNIADQYNSIVLYPFGKKDFGWVKQPAAFENITAELSAVEQTYNTNKNNIFLGGMSNGGSAAFWFITHYPQLFTAFYAFSAMPRLYNDTIDFKHIAANKPLFSVNAKDDEGYAFEKVKAVYEQHASEAPGWHFDSVEQGGHGFIYDDSGLVVMNRVFASLYQYAAARKAVHDSIEQVLIQVDVDDQQYRNKMDEVRERFGGKSQEMRELFTNMNIADSLNLIVAEHIIDKYGWLGADEIGSSANNTLFMVIQHNSLPVQQKYLPVIREAVKNGKANANDLALLEDRVALREGRSQIYGSQLSWNFQANTYQLLPITDPDNLDKRRAVVGLEPYADYLKAIGIKWNLEQYKNDLSELEKQFKLHRMNL